MRVRYGLLLVFVAACGSGSTAYSPTPPPAPPPPPPPPPGATVQLVAMDNYSFSPASPTIKAGTIVRWVNNSTTAHTATSDAGVSPSFDSGSVGPPGQDGYGGTTPAGSFERTFSTPGTYAYHCTFHGTLNNMKGTITVTP